MHVLGGTQSLAISMLVSGSLCAAELSKSWSWQWRDCPTVDWHTLNWNTHCKTTVIKGAEEWRERNWCVLNSHITVTIMPDITLKLLKTLWRAVAAVKDKISFGCPCRHEWCKQNTKETWKVYLRIVHIWWDYYLNREPLWGVSVQYVPTLHLTAFEIEIIMLSLALWNPNTASRTILCRGMIACILKVCI